MNRIGILLVSAVSYPLAAFAQGPLTPPGPPGPMMKTLDQIEPRVAITSLPYTISAPGSYYLPTNLTGVGGITIAADNVTVDLHGFALTVGPGLADGFSVSGLHSRLCIRNGVIADCGGAGVAAGSSANCQLSDLRVVNNGAGGLLIGDGSQVLRCVTSLNGGSGINAGDNCVIRDCSGGGNNGYGITTGVGALVSGCAAELNTVYGFNTGEGTLVADCVASRNIMDGFEIGHGGTLQRCISKGNGGYGIRAYDGVAVANCVARDNNAAGIYVHHNCRVSGCDSSHNSGSGIYVFYPGCLIVGNVCADNNSGASTTEAGIFLDDNDNRVEDNHLTGNGHAGIEVSSSYQRNIIIRNSVAGNGASNYVYPAGNDVGPTGTASAATSPFANISH